MTTTTEAGPSGVLIVDKPKGPTSFRLVAQARRLYQTRTVGHAGTLDPMATGVLLLLVGEATKLSGYLTAAHKTYEATLNLGLSTDSFDAEGAPTEARKLLPGCLSDEALETALQAERGRTEQIPPAFSAIKLAGKPAYALARAGKSVELAPRAVSVQSLTLVAREDLSLRLHLRVSKGYYVRSLIRDLCVQLGVPGHLSQLRRTSSGDFDLREAHPWTPDGPAPALMELGAAARRGLPHAALHTEAVLRARQGKLLEPVDFVTSPPAQGPFAWLDHERLVAIGEACEGGFKVRRGFNA